MCGIAGFSLAPDSTVNARALSHYLLAEITARGQMAAGFGYATPTGRGFHKAAEQGKSLRLKGMPRNAPQVILHTRQATHGSVDDNRNNHPVMSPSEDMMLTHNGVIYNYDTIAKEYLEPSVAAGLPEVDTAIIPAMLEKYGVEGLKPLGGYAALAWLDAKEGKVLNLVRVNQSPVSYTYLDDGSFVYASTYGILKKALEDAELNHGKIESMKEYQHFKIDDGIVDEQEAVPRSTYKGYDYSSRYSSITSGGSATAPARRSNYSGFSGVTGSTASRGGGWGSYADDDLADVTDDQIREWFMSGTTATTREKRYYTVDKLGEYQSYYTVGALVNELMSFTRPSDTYNDPFSNGDVSWVAEFRDVGSLDGADSFSWVDEPSESWAHEPNVANPSLGFIRDGIAMIKALIFI